jgi:hypothetical protein
LYFDDCGSGKVAHAFRDGGARAPTSGPDMCVGRQSRDRRSGREDFDREGSSPVNITTASSGNEGGGAP